MIPSIGIVQGVTKIVESISSFFGVVSDWFTNLPIITLWDSLLPNDIASVVQLFIILMVSLAVLGIIRKFLVIFG